MGNTPEISKLLEKIVIEPLDPSLSRAAFCCGNSRIDNFFRNNAKDQHSLYKVRVYIARIESVIYGYYYLVATSRDPNRVSQEAIKKFGRVSSTPCVYLGMIGIQKEYQGNGIGKILFLHAMEKTAQIAELIGIYALTLDAVDDETASYYERLGFKRFLDNELSMFIPLTTIQKLLN